MTHKHTYTFKATPHIFLCILSGVIINVLGNSITHALHAPILLDSIGTILCSCLLGPVAGSITGILGTILCHISTPYLWWYALSNLPIAFGISILYQRTKLHDTFQLVCSGVLIMIFSTIVSVPLNILLRDGYIGNVWEDALVDMLLQNGNQPLFCCIAGQLFIELPDKILVVSLSYLLIKLFFMINKKRKRRCVKK